MPHPTGPSNPGTRKLIAELRKHKDKLYKDIARHLEKPARSKKAVNLGRLAKLSKKQHTFVVPGRVLSIGEIDKPVHVYALSFSSQAREKIEKAKGKALHLNSFLKDKPKARLVI